MHMYIIRVCEAYPSIPHVSEYPGLLTGCQVIWLCDWTKEALLSEAAFYLSRHSLTQDCEADLRSV